VSLSLTVKERALAAGFDLVGIAPLAAWHDLEFARRWAERGYGGEMHYLRNPKRADARSVLPSAKSVLCVGLVYNAPWPYSTELCRRSTVVENEVTQAPAPLGSQEEPKTDPGQHCESRRAWISRYAWGNDYHEVMRSRLERVRADLEGLVPGVETRVFVDTGPVVERAFARLSGIGWMGKNTCLINQRKGSWFFLGVILTNLDLEPDLPAPDRCGSCTRCLDACPTGALIEPYVMDASRCIAYFNIELKGSIPVEFRPAIGSNLFGCDICQDVCPWNNQGSAGRIEDKRQSRDYAAGNSFRSPPFGARRQRAALSKVPEFRPMMTSEAVSAPADLSTPGSGCQTPTLSLFHPPIEALVALDEENFGRVFARSPIKRVKFRGWLRNLCVVIGNSGDSRFIPWLERVRKHQDPLVREHAAWALAQLHSADHRASSHAGDHQPSPCSIPAGSRGSHVV
jgi:epoxyqueuosine reductase